MKGNFLSSGLRVVFLLFGPLPWPQDSKGEVCRGKCKPTIEVGEAHGAHRAVSHPSPLKNLTSQPQWVP